MNLIDLEPRWIERDGERIGFAFRSPVKPEWWQSCFVVKVPWREQWELLEAVAGGHNYQACDPDCAWSASPPLNEADFETLTISPSLNGARGGLWHGHIQGGKIVGGVP